MKILLKNGNLIDYKTNVNAKRDILIEDEKVCKIDEKIEIEADKVIDCTNLNIVPGMIDMHCHLREPGLQ